MEGRNRRRKLFTTIAVVVVVAAAAIFGAFAAFTATTSNTGNTISSGTVSISDSDGGTGKFYALSDQAPNSSRSSCIRVTYNGNLAATVKLYRTAINAAANGKYTLRVQRNSNVLTGPASDMNCDGWTDTGAVNVFGGASGADLDTLGTSYADGVDAKGSAWSQGNTVDYRFTITVKDDSTPNAHTSDNSTGAHDFVFEARNN